MRNYFELYPQYKYRTFQDFDHSEFWISRFSAYKDLGHFEILEFEILVFEILAFWNFSPFGILVIPILDPFGILSVRNFGVRNSLSEFCLFGILVHSGFCLIGILTFRILVFQDFIPFGILAIPYFDLLCILAFMILAGTG